jgi:hypothetical protein
LNKKPLAGGACQGLAHNPKPEEEEAMSRKTSDDIADVMHRLCLAGEGIQALGLALAGWDEATQETRIRLASAVEFIGYGIADCHEKLEIVFQVIQQPQAA